MDETRKITHTLSPSSSPPRFSDTQARSDVHITEALEIANKEHKEKYQRNNTRNFLYTVAKFVFS